LISLRFALGKDHHVRDTLSKAAKGRQLGSKAATWRPLKCAWNFQRLR